MLIHQFFTPGLVINSYLIYDEESRRGAVIDPTRLIEDYLSFAIQEGIVITDILETHVHADFVSGSQELKAALGGKPTIHCSGLGEEKWTPDYADHVVKNHDTFHVGTLRFEALHTPGHTPEHLIWLVYDEHRSLSIPEIAFTGDLLFVGSVGRPDLLGTEEQEVLARQLYRSLFSTLHSLPDFMEIYPAHGAGSLCGKSIGKKLSSTLGYEKRCNPWLIPQEYGKWFESLKLGSLPIPAYFSRMKERNVKKTDSHGFQEMPHALSSDRIKKITSDDVLVDLRRPEDFALGNIKGSVNIPLTPSFPLWAGSMLPADKNLILVIDRHEAIFSLIQSLSLVGLDRVLGIVDLSLWSASEKEEMLIPSPTIGVEELHADKDEMYLLDVRNEQEWNAGHIEGAHHIELTKFPKILNQIQTQKPIAVICHSGNRASIIASLLEREQKSRVFNVKGGMQSWVRAKFPVTSIN